MAATERVRPVGSEFDQDEKSAEEIYTARQEHENFVFSMNQIFAEMSEQRRWPV